MMVDDQMPYKRRIRITALTDNTRILARKKLIDYRSLKDLVSSVVFSVNVLVLLICAGNICSPNPDSSRRARREELMGLELFVKMKMRTKTKIRRYKRRSSWKRQCL
jgi:hypothetical protein